MCCYHSRVFIWNSWSAEPETMIQEECRWPQSSVITVALTSCLCVIFVIMILYIDISAVTGSPVVLLPDGPVQVNPKITELINIIKPQAIELIEHANNVSIQCVV